MSNSRWPTQNRIKTALFMMLLSIESLSTLAASERTLKIVGKVVDSTGQPAVGTRAAIEVPAIQYDLNAVNTDKDNQKSWQKLKPVISVEDLDIGNVRSR